MTQDSTGHSTGQNGQNGQNGHVHPVNHTLEQSQRVADLTRAWQEDARWQGVTRPYSAEDVLRLRGSVVIEHTLARLGATRLWDLLHSEAYVPALGALTGNQAVQHLIQTKLEISQPGDVYEQEADWVAEQV
ncbi:MAG: hypothetical protein KGO05_00530, partial [Chloroflexota bacterium]|nr:hypothetical protein [Chloroflexota bacterium]